MLCKVWAKFTNLFLRFNISAVILSQTLQRMQLESMFAKWYPGYFLRPYEPHSLGWCQVRVRLSSEMVSKYRNMSMWRRYLFWFRSLRRIKIPSSCVNQHISIIWVHVQTSCNFSRVFHKIGFSPRPESCIIKWWWLHMFYSSFLTKYIRMHTISACNTL